MPTNTSGAVASAIAPPTDTLAIDFGTSNSAVAVLEDGKVRRIPIEGRSETLPTAVFFPKGSGTMRIGEAAIAALVEGEEGRFMRALKSVLGTDLMHEERFLGGRRRTLADVIVAFLRELRTSAEAETGRTFRRVLSGRPVHFHDEPDADRRATNDLRACYAAAGFEDVAFLTEPEAAAVASERTGGVNGGNGSGAAGIGLIVDIGGGTSDFSVYRTANGRPDVLATGGIRLGGTDFDRALSIARVMPELGLGSQLRRAMGSGLLPVPRAPFIELATWVRIPFLYSRETRAMVDGMVRLAVEPERLERLAHVLEMETGHDLAFAVERAKIAANERGDGAGNAVPIAMDAIAPGLTVAIAPNDLNAVLANERVRLRKTAASTLAEGGVEPDDVDRIVLVGGSSLMAFVRDEMTTLCPRAEMHIANVFTAVVDGLAIVSGSHGAVRKVEGVPQ